MNKRLVFSFGFVVALIVASCKHEPPSATPTGGGGTPGVTTDTSICFERDILPIFVSGCARPGCHDAATAAEEYVLTDYTNIRKRGIIPGNANASEIYEVLVENNVSKRMPQAPNPPLSADKISLIKRWIDAGAPNGTNCSQGPCDDAVFTYSGAIKPLISAYCNGCHNSASPLGGVILDTYAGLKTVADNGKLIGSVNHNIGFSAMPKGGNKLSTCQISQIQKWVSAGALNN